MNEIEELRKHIPPGPYCYIVIGERREGGKVVRMTRPCPHFERSDHGVVYCRFIEKQSGAPYGSIIADQQDSYEKALRHYNCVEALEGATPGFILFDRCKECGVNDQYEACANELDQESQRAVDEYARQYGFEDYNELQSLAAQAPLQTEAEQARFADWRCNDFSKAGLLQLIPS